ncbi:MAG TPA: dTMP kinase, partial [Chloroflexota bacterium]|nr:dTMP kinase [Chloroflexota bacterium]
VILPALEAGSVVLSDRYADSTLAYQGFGEQLILADLEAITQFATDGLRPDLTVLVDVDVEVGLGRRRAAFRAGDGELNRIDRRDLAYHRRVRDGYHFLASREPERFLVVDGALPAGDIAGHVWARISTMLGRHQPLPALAR